MMNNSLEVQFGGVTTAGKRDVNQDAFAVHKPPSDIVRAKGIGACVADGVSSSVNAQQASSTSVTHFLQDYYSTPDNWDVKSSAAKVLSSLNAWLFHHGHQASAHENALVTTFSGLVLKGQTAHLLHVGDSRIYQWRDGTLEQLTRDHVHSGSGQAFLSRALGMDTRLEMDYHQRDIRAGDVFLLCTDGLHVFASRGQLVEVLSKVTTETSREEMEAFCQDLVNAAIASGSDDNASCVLMCVQSVPDLEMQEIRREPGVRVVPPVLKEGESLDHFVIQELLYSSHRSHLYRAVNKRDGRVYAIKAASGSSQNDQLCAESFAREQWIGSHLAHPNLMKIIPQEEESRFMYHVCEWIDGISLRQWMFDHPQADLVEVRQIVDQLVQGLRAMQRMGMVHRDLKPENIMLTADGTVKIVDYASVAMRGLRELAAIDPEHLPKSSENYIAPEYLLEGVSNTQSDIYALAVITSEMLTGRSPFDAATILSRKSYSRSDWKYRSVRDIRPDLPLWLEVTLKKGCCPDPGHRYVAYSEFLADLYRPNDALVSQYVGQSLRSRNPQLFWQLVAAGASLVAVVEAILLVVR
jgi:serine/threonine protein phosphatase PrpC